MILHYVALTTISSFLIEEDFADIDVDDKDIYRARFKDPPCSFRFPEGNVRPYVLWEIEILYGTVQ